MSRERVRKHLNYLFVKTGNAQNNGWERVETSTDFAVAFNAETETFDYISDENPSDELKFYKPTIGQTQTAYIGDSVFDTMFDFAFGIKAGAEAITKGMIVFQQKNPETGKNLAWLFDMTVTIDTYDVVAGTLTYQMGIRGTIERGEAVMGENGPEFTAVSAPVVPID